ncbi:DUF2391 domain-containing protein [Vibrio albus]|uniref:DUF2391 domain-containing protein n=1 Tax=Vibrio albus TaxID=2200953 RepID=A0A2U3B620_9VIBR|nr:DUF2391 family protein [Vibrio albus]PWI32238.1 DUF2391 domain-containing protein [Vibrio albus]
MKISFNLEDASQIFVGAFALAVPVSFSEEAWKMGQTLPLLNLGMLWLLSIFFLGFYTYYSVFQENIRNRVFVFIARMFIAYFFTAIIVALILFSLDKLPLLTEPVIALKRIVIITMPASMGAIVVDSFDKE